VVIYLLLRVPAGILLMLVGIMWAMLSVVVCCTIVGFPIGMMMFLGCAGIFSAGVQLLTK
jgi:hypothetical protein